jgi:two-component system, OmpR family, response regulator
MRIVNAMGVSSVSFVDDWEVSSAGKAGAPAKTAVVVIGMDPRLAEEIRVQLEVCGRAASRPLTAGEALDAARGGLASALIVDRTVNGTDSLWIVETLRREGNNTPILVVGPSSSVDDRIHALIAGADDYLVKPFDVRELAARIGALLRREARATRLKVGELEMDLVARSVRCAGRSVELLPQEYKLLEYFMRRPDETIARATLLEHVWDARLTAGTNVVDVQVGNLRRKLDPTGERRYVVSVRAVGFKLKASP